MIYLQYFSTNFKLALKSALYDLVNARDVYREATLGAGLGMHRDVLLRYAEMQALIIAPITPHWAEYIWLDVLKKVRPQPFSPQPFCKCICSRLNSPRQFTDSCSPKFQRQMSPSLPPQLMSVISPPTSHPPRPLSSRNLPKERA